MKVMVFGSKGLIGKEVCHRLENDGHTVEGVDLNTHHEFMSDWMAGDINFNLIIRHYQPKAVVNCTYPKEWLKHIEVTVGISLASVIHFIDIGGGTLINFGSIYGVVGPNPEMYAGSKVEEPSSTYSFVKGGTIAFTRALATKYARHGIQANCISPGGVWDNHDNAFVEEYEERTPDSLMAAPRNISGVVSFLVSSDSSYINGQNIIVDGGYTAW